MLNDRNLDAGAVFGKDVPNQRIAFYLSLFNFLWLAAQTGARVYFVLVDDSPGERHFAFHPRNMGMLPLWALSWIVAFVLVGNSIREARQVTRYGLATLVMLSIPAIPVSIFVCITYWRFLAVP